MTTNTLRHTVRMNSLAAQLVEVNEHMINSVSPLTQEHFSAAIQWISKMSSPDCWDLTNEEAAHLLGIDVAIFNEMQSKALSGQHIKLTSGAMERLSLLIGVWEGLNLFVPHERQDLAFLWFSKPTTNPAFNHKSIKNFLLENNNVEAFCEVITYLRAQH